MEKPRFASKHCVRHSRWAKTLLLIALIGGVVMQLLGPRALVAQPERMITEEICAGQKGVVPGEFTGTVIDLKILLVQFTDVRCRMEPDGVTPRYGAKDFEDLLGSEGVYASPAMHSPDGDDVMGSMNDYFLKMSGGKLRIRAHVINGVDSGSGKPVWITLGNTKFFYHQISADEQTIFDDAVQAAWRAGLDASLSDTTRLAIIYAGNTYWLRNGAGGLNPVEFGPEYLMSELQGKEYNSEHPDTKFSRIAIHCHEFAHTLDIGHTTGGRADIMCGGWINGSVTSGGDFVGSNAPAPFNAIVRATKGWANVVHVSGSAPLEVDIPYSLTSPTVYVLQNSSGDQFYVENRRFDQTMTIGATVVPDYNNVAVYPLAGPHHSIREGILVWRVNTYGDVLDPGYSTQGLVYASGRFGRTYPENEQSDTDDGVPFPGVSNARLLTPWSDPRNPYIKETDYFGSGSTHYSTFVPNTKGGESCGMEIISEDSAAGSFRVRFYPINPPNPTLASQPVADSIGVHEARRTVAQQDSAHVLQVMAVGGEVFYRRSTDAGRTWTIPSRLSQGNGGNSTPTLALAGSALLLAWQMDAYDAADSGRVVYCTRSTDGGRSWSDYSSVGWSYHCSLPGAYPLLAGAGDGSAMIVYRSERASLASLLSHDAGASWTDGPMIPVGSIAWSSPSLSILGRTDEALFTYTADSLAGPGAYAVRFTFGTATWGSPETVSGAVPPEYAGYRNPEVFEGTGGASVIAWDAIDAYSGTQAIISRTLDAGLSGSSCSIFRGLSQECVPAAQFPMPSPGSPRMWDGRELTLTDSLTGASMSLENGVMRVIHSGGKPDTIRFTDPPPDSLILDTAGLIRYGSSAAVPCAGTDTLQIIAALCGRNPGALFLQGRVGFEIVNAAEGTVIRDFAFRSVSSIEAGTRKFMLCSLPLANVLPAGGGAEVLARPAFVGLRSDNHLKVCLAHIYSTQGSNPVDQLATETKEHAPGFSGLRMFALEQNYPNPFNPSTRIRYVLPATASVRLTVFNSIGQEVVTLVNGVEGPGMHEASLDGSGLASGVYFYRLTAGSYAAVKKLVVVR